MYINEDIEQMGIPARWTHRRTRWWIDRPIPVYPQKHLFCRGRTRQEGHDGPGSLTWVTFPTNLFYIFVPLVPTCDPRGGASFDPKGHHVNKIDKGLQGDATYRKSKFYLFQFQRRRILNLVFFVPTCNPSGFDPKGIIWIKLIKVHKEMIKPNIEALILPVSEKKNFEVGYLCSYVPICDPPGEASFDPTSIWTNLVDVHRDMLKTKYQSSIPSSFRGKEFWRWDSSFLYSNLWPTVGANLDPMSIIWTNLVEVYQKMLHTKYQSSSAYGLGQEDF